LANFAKNNPGFPANQLICGDFFKLEQRDFDYVVEQTFFCAILPEMRPDYAQKMSEILKEGGKLVGLLFGEALDLDRDGPPFGGNREEYMDYFTPHFRIVKMEECKNSIKPREGSELFIEIIK
jgi:methyl halide transferase